MVVPSQARIWDMRRLEAGSSLQDLPHGRVVNAAYFSPQSGCKILTTSQDNRIRVWDSIFGNLNSPSREIVHSHDFNRHLTPFRAEWDPKVTLFMLCKKTFILKNFNCLCFPFKSSCLFSDAGPIRVPCGYWSLHK